MIDNRPFVPLSESALRQALITTAGNTLNDAQKQHLRLDEAFPYLLVGGTRFDLGLKDNPFPFSDYFVPDTRQFWTQAIDYDKIPFWPLDLLVPFCNIVAKHVTGKVFISTYYSVGTQSTFFDPVIYYENEADAVIMGADYFRDTAFYTVPPRSVLYAMRMSMIATGKISENAGGPASV